MNTQRREEIREISASLLVMHLNGAANAIDELFDWIDQLEAKAAERVISDGPGISILREEMRADLDALRANQGGTAT